MVHPKPNDPVREAFYGWLLGKPYALEALPPKLQEYVVYKFDRSQAFPDVPFQMLTAWDCSGMRFGASGNAFVTTSW
jgi:60 kDa SS-A/Ro ribonucleoprotein